LSFIEFRTPAIYHACYIHLNRLDALQRSFVHEQGLSEEEALIHFSLAPLRLRRDIALLGLIHRTVLGQGPSQFKALFVLDTNASVRCSPQTRLQARRHSKQLLERRDTDVLEISRRSCFGLISVCNLLPRAIVDAISVQSFQACLQALAKKRIAEGARDWQCTFSPRVDLCRHPLLKFD
jgi:hypothetical protein